MSETFSNQQKRWIDDYCNGVISPEEFALMEQELIASGTFRKLARSYLAMDSHLQGAIEIETIQQRAWNGSARPEVRAKKRPLLWALAATLVFFLGLGSGGFINFNQTAVNTDSEILEDGIATVEHAIDTVWDTDMGSGLTAGSILSPGPLKLISGLAQLEFYNGAQLILEGPVSLDLKSVSEVICKNGKLRALIPESAHGFTVLSDKFELVDLGTEFGVEVGNSGDAKVEVYDGEVELYPPDGLRSPDQKTRLPGGSGMSWDGSGGSVKLNSLSEGIPSFEAVRVGNRDAKERRFARWKRWNQAVQSDPRVVVHYDFEDKDGSMQLLDRGAGARHGTIVGGEYSRGRFPGKGAIEFKRPGDRVRFNVPGEFDQLTLSAWLRMDALTGRIQALLLTDGYQVGRAHWQVSREGNLRLGLRLPGSLKVRKKAQPITSGYGSPVIFGPRTIGTWNFVCSVYDRTNGTVSHYMNGREVSSEPLAFDQPIQLGNAEIGNWGMPYNPDSVKYEIRNFVGRFDTVTAWSAALDSEEIRRIYLETRP
ncbi:MAG: hypothetical protein P1U89_27415 [Verrucomicrobiales bacterium]|nr:hypothetical protein [Verrucomicrobiales bacterium]